MSRIVRLTWKCNFSFREIVLDNCFFFEICQKINRKQVKTIQVSKIRIVAVQVAHNVSILQIFVRSIFDSEKKYDKMSKLVFLWRVFLLLSF